MNTSFSPAFDAGQELQGKWNGGQYLIEALVGEGNNGRVFRVSRKGHRYALKVGTDPVDVQAEVNVLQALSKVEGSFSRFLVDVDDFCWRDQYISGYVMQFVKGRQLQQFLADRGKEWFPLVGLRLLEQLKELHASGYVFGDLKRENVLVSDYGQVQLVDFGGVTALGRGVRQFTEMYDRGSWKAGSRTADEAYDLFAFAILSILVYGTPKTSLNRYTLPQNRQVDSLLEEVGSDPSCRPYLSFLSKALQGEFRSSAAACEEWRVLMRGQMGHRPDSLAAPPPTKLVRAGFIVSAAVFAGVLWYYW